MANGSIRLTSGWLGLFWARRTLLGLRKIISCFAYAT
jgi:hypothetical protein